MADTDMQNLVARVEVDGDLTSVLALILMLVALPLTLPFTLPLALMGAWG
jgi:lipopolysaccharide export LptBFGC system permease protein LptF